MTLFDLAGRVALVTGARRGLGQGLAEALASAGADIVGLGPHEMSSTGQRIAAHGRKFSELRCDLGQGVELAPVVDDAIGRFGRIDILINSAGMIRRSNALDLSETDWDDVVALNLRSVFFLSQLVARHMVSCRCRGRIINIASLLSFQGGIRVASYAASKHGIAGITRAMANDLAPHGITVNAIAPGYMETHNTEALRRDAERSREILARIPMGRWGKPGDLATAVLFLAAPASDYVTGAIIPVDGGWLAR
ncbi:MAG: 2-dehydro-3-deoxy-D-gluconate 5-dehydrogenase KduD [Aestuariivirgaceae bacterium]